MRPGGLQSGPGARGTRGSTVFPWFGALDPPVRAKATSSLTPVAIDRDSWRGCPFERYRGPCDHSVACSPKWPARFGSPHRSGRVL